MDSLKRLLFWILSVSFVSSLTGRLASIESPKAWVRWTIQLYFVRHWKVTLHEARLPLEEYKSPLAFFTRQLKAGCRPIHQGKHSPSKSVISPVDGTLLSHGTLNEGRRFTVKGSSYSLEDVLGEAVGAPYEAGTYMVIYLSPRDCHWVHHPVSGMLLRAVYVPGRLLPVNAFAMQAFPKVYTQNKRVSLHYRSDLQGFHCAMTLIGALNVGNIQMSHHPRFYQEAAHHTPQHVTYSSLRVTKGDPCAVFNLGSTVILFLSRTEFLRKTSLEQGQSLRMGEPIGSLR